jgi:hypothetical protein
MLVTDSELDNGARELQGKIYEELRKELSKRFKRMRFELGSFSGRSSETVL